MKAADNEADAGYLSADDDAHESKSAHDGVVHADEYGADDNKYQGDTSDTHATLEIAQAVQASLRSEELCHDSALRERIIGIFSRFLLPGITGSSRGTGIIGVGITAAVWVVPCTDNRRHPLRHLLRCRSLGRLILHKPCPAVLTKLCPGLDFRSAVTAKISHYLFSPSKALKNNLHYLYRNNHEFPKPLRS